MLELEARETDPSEVNEAPSILGSEASVATSNSPGETAVANLMLPPEADSCAPPAITTCPPTSEIDWPEGTESALPWTVIVALRSGAVRNPYPAGEAERNSKADELMVRMLVAKPSLAGLA